MKRKMKLNPNKEIVQEVREGLKAKGGYCPCRIGETEDNICPCVPFREEGDCVCQLYVPVEE